jgi:adenylosuccinate synthase
MTSVTVVVGGQYGSEGKGAVAGFLGHKQQMGDLAIRVAGPNAGHTTYDDNGVEWKLRAVPVAAATSRDCELHIAAGSEVDISVLFDEIHRLEYGGHRVQDRLSIHPSATILEPGHISNEQASGIVGRIGSTGKGIGAARMDRLARNAHVAKDVKSLQGFLSEPGPLDLHGIGKVVVEGTQGYGLGLHTENYPQVTSSDCRAIDFLSMAGISPWATGIDLRVLVVARTYPIRVAGNSGPLEGETTWADLGLPEEHTTVTHKVRRVGAWDAKLLEEAIRANGGGDWSPKVQLVVTMLDQLFPETAGQTNIDQFSEAARGWLLNVQDNHEIDVAYVGTGPQTMFEVTL